MNMFSTTKKIYIKTFYRIVIDKISSTNIAALIKHKKEKQQRMKKIMFKSSV